MKAIEKLPIQLPLMNIRSLIFIPLCLILINCSKHEKDCEYYQEFYENSQLRLEGCLTNDSVRIGKFIEYYPSGKVKNIVEYENNEREGQEIWYWENGNLKAKLNYKNDKLSGVQFTYNKIGAILSKYNFENGQKVGESLSFFKNGIISNYSYFSLNGEPVYRAKYDSTGEVKSEEGNLMPIVNINSDELSLGDTLKVDIYVINPPNYNVSLYIGTLSESNTFIKKNNIPFENGLGKVDMVIKSPESFNWAVLVEAKSKTNEEVKPYINSFKINVK